MKKILAIAAAAVLCLCCAACGCTNSAPATMPSTRPTMPTTMPTTIPSTILPTMETNIPDEEVDPYATDSTENTSEADRDKMTDLK